MSLSARERKTDGELLSAYARDASESSFDELVERHAAKVFAAALRVLGDRHAAEDVSQATFLLLARKAKGLIGHSAVSGWLFRTAGFIAARQARKRGSRRSREEAAVKLRESGKHDGAWRELAPELDAAVGELPVGYRDAVILRHVDGLTQKETARELGISESAVSMRVSRGLEKLRERLGSRGVVLSVSLLALLLGERAGEAGEVKELVASIQAVCRGTAEVPVSVRSVMEEAMKAMRWKKFRIVAAAAAVLIAAALIAPSGVNAWAGGNAAEESQAARPAPEPEPVPQAAAAAPEKKPAAKPKKVAATRKQKAEVVREANAFAFDFYSQLREDRDQAGKNIFFSPFSISSALAMTYAGANGNTATQMAKAMHFDLKEQELHPAFSDLTEELNKRGKTANFQLAVANRLWGQKDYAFLQNFLEMNRLYYGAGIERVNFKKDPEACRKTINAWVEKKTQERIKDLIPRRALKDDTRLVLTNAIYFKADWQTQFKKNLTRDRDFELPAGKRVKVPTMNQTARFPYAQCDGFKALEMAYKGDELSMVALLPDRRSSLGALEKKLSAETLEAAVKKLREQSVYVSLPKFETTLSLSLKKHLQAMGMTDAFVYGPADFSGMDGTRYLFISAIVHKAFVRVDEKGTEAAAATAVMMAGGARPRYERFAADRPFFFLIRDRKTGSILFMGRIMNPAGKA